MADFHAGSIDATLTLDTSPFRAGLAAARREAEDFEKRKYEAHIGLDEGRFRAETLAANASLDKLAAKRVEPKADLDISKALAKASILNKALDAGGLGGRTVGPGLAAGKLTLMAGGLMSVAAAAAPASAALIGFGAAAGTAFAGAGVALGLFAKVAAADMKTIEDANKKGIQLTGSAGMAQKALKGLSTEWAQLQKSTGPAVFGVLGQTFKLLASIIPRLAPLINVTAIGLGHVVSQLAALAKSPLFTQFLGTLEKFMGGFLTGLGSVLRNLMSGFMHAFIVLQPLMAQIGRGVLSVSKAMDQFAAGNGLKTVVGYIERWLPALSKLFMDTVHGLGSLAKGIAPLTGPALRFIDALVRAIGGLNLAPFAKGFGAVLDAAKPLLGVLGALVNTILEPLGRLLSVLAKSGIAPLAHALKSELQPAFAEVKSVLNSIAKPLGNFLASIANLINPTGVHLVVTLIQGLGGVLKALLPPLLNAATYIEGFVDKGIEKAIPYLQQFFDWLNRLHKPTVTLGDGMSVLKRVFESVRPGLSAMGHDFEAMGKGVLQLGPPIGRLGLALGKTLLPAFRDLALFIVNRVLPVFTQIANWFINKIVPIVVRSVSPALRALAQVFVTQVLPGVMKVWNAIRPLIPLLEKLITVVVKVAGFLLRTLLPPLIQIAGFIVGHLLGAIAAIITGFTKMVQGVIYAVTHLKSWLAGAWNTIETGFKQLGSGMAWVYDHGIKPIWNAFGKALDALKGAFNHAVDGIEKAWGRIKEAAAGPVHFVIGTVLDKGLIGGINAIGGFFHLPKVPTVSNNFGGGGKIPGSAPHDEADNVVARVTPGEYMVRRRSVRQIEQQHPGALDYINTHGRLPGYSVGGIIHDIGKAASGAFNWAKSAASKMDPIGFIEGKVNSLLGGVQNYGLGKIAAAAGKRAISGAVNWLQSRLGGFFGGGPGGGPIVWPLPGAHWSTYPGHDGIDLNTSGQDYGKPFYAAAAGRISYTGWGHGYGDAIFEKGPYGTLVYGHGSKVAVKAGQMVRPGQYIGNVGSTGHSTGPHLHIGFPGGTAAQILAFLRGATKTVGKVSGASRWAPYILRALGMLHQPSSLLGAVEHRLMQESGGNQYAINKWDINAALGDPSRGLMQVIGGTFNRYAGPLRQWGIYNPLANIYAGLNYALHRYGSIYTAMMKPGGYAAGTNAAAAGWHWVGEGGPELVRFHGGEKVLSHKTSVAATDNSDMLALLRAILDKLASADDIAEATGRLSQAQIRALIQASRAA